MKYIRLPGDPQGRPPYLGRGVLMHGGFLTCGHGHLARLCEDTLNQVDPEISFQVVGNLALYAALYAERMSSDHPEDRLFGSVPEADIGLWVLTWGGRKGEPRLRWTPAFIFVDGPSALMTGRELYGYPKQMGRMVRRANADAEFSVSLRAIAFERQDPKEIGREREVLRVSRDKDAGNAVVESDFSVLLGAVRDLIDRSGDWVEAIDALSPPFLGMPMVFLRQMRDVTTEDAAMMQEIAAVTVEPTQIVAGGLADRHQITFPPLASFPIADVLGCSPTSDIRLPFWARFDFRVGTGQRL